MITLTEHEAEVNQQELEELIVLLRKIDEHIELHGDTNELCLLLRDFAHELLKQRLLCPVQLFR